MELEKIVDPIQLFKKWFSEAEEKEIRDPNAMQLATVSKDGMPSVRTVLLKDIIDGDFVFYTNYQSQKGKELFHNNKEIMNARYPSAQWTDDSVYSIDNNERPLKWCWGYYSKPDQNDENYYDKGEIIDHPHDNDNINLRDFVDKQTIINSNFTLKDSLANLKRASYNDESIIIEAFKDKDLVNNQIQYGNVDYISKENIYKFY